MYKLYYPQKQQFSDILENRNSKDFGEYTFKLLPFNTLMYNVPKCSHFKNLAANAVRF